MSLADNPRKYSILTMAAGIIIAASGIALFFDNDLDGGWNVIGGVGHIVAGVLIAGAGYIIFSGIMPGFATRFFPDGPDSKISILIGYFSALGVASILGLGTNIISIAIGFTIGVAILIVVMILTNDRNGTVNRSLWIVLNVSCFLGIVGNLLAIYFYSNIATIAGICGCLMYLLADVYLFDNEVKMKFGM